MPPTTSSLRSLPSATELRDLGIGAGLDAVEVTGAEPFDDVRHVLEQRREAGLHGGMAFTYRNPARSTDPSRTVEEARSLVVAAKGYLAEEPVLALDGPVARIARYAWRDHYAELRAGLEVVAGALRGAGWTGRVLADDNALVDRAAAHRAGIGWWGKSANLLLPGLGSWYVLGAVVTDAPLEPTGGEAADGCGPCTRCMTGCPTGAIPAPGVVDARRCLAWLLQAEGPFPREHRAALGDRIYGCDVCQEVCPPNRPAVPAADAGGTSAAPLLELLDPDDEVVLRWAERWYIPRREVRYVRRNALVVLGNVGDGRDPSTEAILTMYLAGEDSLLAAHAVWAARRLGREDLLAGVDGGDPLVADELAAATEARHA